MTEVTLLGVGASLGACHAVLRNAGVDVALSLDDDAGANSPVLLGEAPGLYNTARQLLEGGRGLMICSPRSFAPSELEGLLLTRQPGQALTVWNCRRPQPANRLIAGLVRAGDPAWQPRFVRSVYLDTDRPSSALLDWRTIESLALLLQLTDLPPMSVSAIEAPAGERARRDFVAISLAFADATAFLQVGLGEAVEQRQTMLAASTRRAYVDELNHGSPLRILDEKEEASSSRFVSYTAADEQEVARLQVVAFLDCVHQRDLADAEATLIGNTLAVWRAAQVSLAQAGAPVALEAVEQAAAELSGPSATATLSAIPS